ncbi:MAG TPA: hypothetical protein DDZ39_00100 [Flavobacteriaceae bacterium]|jgi:hypothetical protein|nr:hypothetical protein [Flavobacteriaceae bacterium]HBS12477.1 hypothetical protein [Flavobacteriaceae bacterium]
MKYLFLILALKFTVLTFSQQHKGNRYEVTAVYGLSYDSFYEAEASFSVDLSGPMFGSVMEFGLDYALPKNRFIGVAFTKQLHVKNIDKNILSTVSNSGLSFDNYRISRQKNFYEVHFRKQFKNKFHLTLGVFYFQTYLNTLRFNIDGVNQIYALNNDKQRADNLGLSLSLDYYFPIREYLELGLRGKMVYTLDGAETVYLSPILKVSF